MSQTVCVIGLGYVGLPLAVALARDVHTVGFDVDQGRVAELRDNFDRTNEIDAERLAACTMEYTSDPAELPPADFYIVTVPTPIKEARTPDLKYVESASETVGRLLGAAKDAGKEPIIVYESTVYPGVTEDVCAPILERESGLKWKTDFFLGYSPERINPGDREHTVDRITKVVSGDSEETCEKVAALYDRVTTGGTFKAASIRAAEAAKVIENAQRDINIAFMNEIARIFELDGISVWDVLDAAKTKWNFLPFSPGLVGGHCIGVDPYYLAHYGRQLGHEPKVILAGRSINDSMAEFLSRTLSNKAGEGAATALVLGLTFKEDVPDMRNSKVADVVDDLKARRIDVTLHDPLADKAEVEDIYGVPMDEEALSKTYDIVLVAVPHREYLDMGADCILALRSENGVAADLKNAFANDCFWTL